MGSHEWLSIATIVAISLVVEVVVILKAIARQTKEKNDSRLEAFRNLNLKFKTKIDAETSKNLDSVLKIQKLHTQKKTSLARGYFRDHYVYLLNLESIVSTGQSTVTIRQSVCLIPLKTSVPEMTITPKNILHSIGKMLGAKQLTFPTHPDFSKKFTVSGKKEDAIKDFMTPEVLEFLEKRPQIYWAISKNTLMYYQPSKEWFSLHEIDRFLKYGVRLIDRLTPS